MTPLTSVCVCPPSEYQGPLDCVRQLVRRHGVTVLWRGLFLTCCRDSLGMGAFFVANHLCLEGLAAARDTPPSPGDRRTLGELVLAGSAAGLAFWAVGLPIDALKSVVQAKAPEPGEFPPGTLQTAWRTTVGREGFAALFRGSSVAFSRGVPSAAITITTFNRAMEFIDDGG